MDGLMMDYDLTLPAMMRRAESLYGTKEIVTRNPDKTFYRYTYADFIRRATSLSVALASLGKLHEQFADYEFASNTTANA